MTSPLVIPLSGNTTRSVFVRATVTSPNVSDALLRAGRRRDVRGDLDGDIDPRLDVGARRDHRDELPDHTRSLGAELAGELARGLDERCAGLHPQDDRLA